MRWIFSEAGVFFVNEVGVAQVALFFGSDEGNTESIAYKIQEILGKSNVDVFDIADATQLEFAEYKHIILGIPTWDFGQIQSDWEEFWDDISDLDFSGTKVALFGLGDQFGYGDFFLDAMGMLHDVVKGKGANMVGYWPIEGYEFDASKALIESQNCFAGLALDEDQQPELTSDRLNTWCQQIVDEMDLNITVNPL